MTELSLPAYFFMNNIGKNSFDLGYLDTLAGGNSWLHRLDPRAKLAVTLMFIITVVSFDKYALAALTPFFIYPALLISLGGLPCGYLAKKVLIVAPFAVLVGIFNPLIDRTILFYIGPVGISGGWISFISILMRFALTVSAALILISLTGFGAVCDALMNLGVPRPFVIQLAFFYRYVFVLTDEAERMARARWFRAPDAQTMGFGVFVPLAGHLLLRTLDRAERVYQAMRCRGFDGRIRMIRPARFGYREIVFILGWALLFIFLRYSNLPLKLGALAAGYLK